MKSGRERKITDSDDRLQKESIRAAKEQWENMFLQQKRKTCITKSKLNSGRIICFKRLHKCIDSAKAVLRIRNHTTQQQNKKV